MGVDESALKMKPSENGRRDKKFHKFLNASAHRSSTVSTRAGTSSVGEKTEGDSRERAAAGRVWRFGFFHGIDMADHFIDRRP